ncbi:hypothetical protein [Leptolyngbya sp. FACHB-261]|uniref:hypothetical protein n=1 Tax=Leptolyngbya sp. FACHB-261 TaxID=2692806 RepID=UPI0016865259|nr:hypothetical protein [Leptolyngbya sp. FACHB-261]MBD2104286.1 hypothetical protein [Leptolyngbya sp. FACHB-261]
MIHHFSMAANNPLHVAQVLAELLQGTVAPFSKNPGSYVVFTEDVYGTLIEISPQGLELQPGSGDESFCYSVNHSRSSGYSVTHFNLSVAVSEAKIRAVAAREGWRTVRVSAGGFFEVMEFWVENQTLLELMPPPFTTQYLAFLHSEKLKNILAGMTIPAPDF